MGRMKLVQTGWSSAVRILSNIQFSCIASFRLAFHFVSAGQRVCLCVWAECVHLLIYRLTCDDQRTSPFFVSVCFVLPFRKRPQTPSSLQKVNELATRKKSMINKSSLFRLPINTTQTRPNKQTKKTTTTENTQWTFDTKKKLNQSIFFPPRVNSVNKYWKKRRKKNQTSGVKILLLILRKTSFFSSSNKLYVLMLSLLCLLCGLENAVWNRRTYRSIGRSCDRIKVYNVPHFCFFLF